MLLWRTRRPQPHLPEHTRAMSTQSADQRDVPSEASGLRWRRALGLQFLGPVQGSGLRDPSFLVRRIDDQVVQLSELLHLVVVHAEPPRTSAEVADAVSAAYGRTLTAEGVEHLVATRLAAARTGRGDRGRGAPSSDPGPSAAGAHPQGHAAPSAMDASRRRAARAAVVAADHPDGTRRDGHRRHRPDRRRGLLARGERGVRHADDGARDLRPAGRLGRHPRAGPRLCLPLRRRRARGDRGRCLPRVSRVLHRRHRLLPPRPRRAASAPTSAGSTSTS